MITSLKKKVVLLWDFGFEYLVTGILGAIPTPIGSLLRNLIYKLVLSRIGFMVQIKPDVRIVGAKQIEIGSRAQLSKGACLRSGGNSIVLEDEVCLREGVFISSHKGFGGKIVIGKRTRVGRYVCIGGPGKVIIGKDCMIANHTSIHGANHLYGEPGKLISQQGLTCKGVVIEDNCWLGAGVRVLDGTTIGKGSVIGAGAVVTQDIPPYSLAVGVPAKVIKRYYRGTKRVYESSIPKSIECSFYSS